MKNRRIAILAFLMAAVLCLGIGYAAATDDLAVNGTVSVSADALDEAFAEKVYFADAVGATGVTATIGSPDGDDSAVNKNDVLTINVADTVLTEDGAYATVTVKIQNDNTASAASIALTVDDTALEAYNCTVTMTGAASVAPQSSETYTITITLTDMSAGEFTNTAFSVALTATAVANS